MQTETHNSIKPSKSSPGNQRPKPQRFPRRKPAGQGQRVPNKPFAFRREVSCGGIIYRRRGGSVEIFFIKDPFQRWTFPKGHQEAGEDFVQTAVREIREETGLENLKLIAPLGKTSFRFRRDSVVIHKDVHFFLFEAAPDAKEKLTGEGAIYEAQWTGAARVFAVSSYKNSDKLLARALRIIAENSRPKSPHTQPKSP